MRQALRFCFQRLIFTDFGSGLFDLRQHMAQIIGLAAHLALARREIGLALLQLLQSRVRITHGHALDFRVGVGVEDITLGIGMEQRLRLVLTVQIHQEGTNLCQHADRCWRSIHPRARFALPQYLTLQHQPTFFQLDAEGGERRQKMSVYGGCEFEGALDDRLVGAGAHDVGGGAFAEQQ